GIARGLIRGGRAVESESHAIKMFAVGVSGRNCAVVLETPVESAVLLVPKSVCEIVDAVAGDGEVFVLHFGAAENDLRSDPSLAALEDGEFPLCAIGLPVAGEVGGEAAVLVVDGAREPDVEDVAAQGGFD